MTDKPRPLASTLRYDFVDVKNCLQNARRLRRDAYSPILSAGSKAALLELALEETGKAAILCLRIFAHKRQEDLNPVLSPEGETLKAALLEIATPHERESIRNAYDLKSFLDQFPLDELFRLHAPKLGAIAKLAKIVKVSMKVMKSHPQRFLDLIEATPSLRKQLRRLAKVPESDFEKLREFQDPSYLLSVREGGIYVALDPRRTATQPPPTGSDEIPRLKAALRAASALVEGWALAYEELVKS